MATKSGRTIIAEEKMTLTKFFFKWEWLLVVIFVAVNIMNISISPNYNLSGVLNATTNYLDKAFIALPMAYILLLGDIDISVGSIVALSAVIMAMAFNAGVPMGVAVIICLLVGTICGLINGLILTKFTELAPMIVTLGTQILYRGIAEVLLGDEASGGLTTVKWFSDLNWGKIGIFPYMLIIFIVCAAAFGFVMHKTTFGRRLYAIGSNRTAAAYAGIQVQKIRLSVFMLTGFFSAVAAIFLAARMGSTRSNIATGYELEAISMCVLGGMSTDGGKGNFTGVVISVFVFVFLRYGLGLINVSSQVMLVILGGMLVVAVLLPNLKLGNLLKKKVKSA